jgi:hypothetical protein
MVVGVILIMLVVETTGDVELVVPLEHPIPRIKTVTKTKNILYPMTFPLKSDALYTLIDCNGGAA